MTLKNIRDPEDPVLVRRIARVIDGQHRIAGLYQCRQDKFDCPVTILIGTDIADQAQMFARVNLSQTRVNPSLVYDLFELAQTRSPQKICHDVVVDLDKQESGPFYRRVKRLGVATVGRTQEMLTQATMVKGLMPHISDFPDRDRDAFLRGRGPSKPGRRENERMIFREWFIDDRKDEITAAVASLFEAVRQRWPEAWNATGQGYVLPRTNGYLALMRFLRDSTLYWAGPNSYVPPEKHLRLLQDVRLNSDDITTENFGAGTSGEASLYQQLRAAVPL